MKHGGRAGPAVQREKRSGAPGPFGSYSGQRIRKLEMARGTMLTKAKVSTMWWVARAVSAVAGMGCGGSAESTNPPAGAGGSAGTDASAGGSGGSEVDGGTGGTQTGGTGGSTVPRRVGGAGHVVAGCGVGRGLWSVWRGVRSCGGRLLRASDVHQGVERRTVPPGVVGRRSGRCVMHAAAAGVHADALLSRPGVRDAGAHTGVPVRRVRRWVAGGWSSRRGHLSRPVRGMRSRAWPLLYRLGVQDRPAELSGPSVPSGAVAGPGGLPRHGAHAADGVQRGRPSVLLRGDDRVQVLPVRVAVRVLTSFVPAFPDA
jgi:hypothetical protein